MTFFNVNLILSSLFFLGLYIIFAVYNLSFLALFGLAVLLTLYMVAVLAKEFDLHKR